MTKKTITAVLCIAAMIFMISCPTSIAAPSYESYLSIRPGDALTFTYTVTPVDPEDQARQSQLSVDIPFVINTIVEINTTSCNVTYTATFKILVDGIPRDKAQATTRTISNSTNATAYVYSANNPWELFFINNVTTTARTVIVPQNASLPIGYGAISWDQNGVLIGASFTTPLNGVNCLVTIAPKTGGGKTRYCISTPGLRRNRHQAIDTI